jgi:UDP-glucose 4-epimerase
VSDAVMTHRVSWSGEGAGGDLRTGLDRLAELAVPSDRPWRLVWCAGAGVTGSSAGALHREVETLVDFLAVLADRHRQLRNGTVFLASSAGGLYAGSPAAAPYTEDSPAVAVSAYGEAKLATEQAARAYADVTGNQVLIGRIANLYGPGQNLSKPQGLISHLCRAQLTKVPLSVYVSLDTIRDYLYVDDCAEMIADMLEPQVLPDTAPPTLVKILASQQGTTIAGLVSICRHVFRRQPRIVLGTSGDARLQVKDLRLKSVVWPDIDRRSLTPLPAGVATTAAGILRHLQQAQL